MSQVCGKIPIQSDVDYIIVNFLLHLLNDTPPDLSISDSPDPFKDPVETIRNSKEWITTKGNLIKVYTSKTGQVNYEIFSGPDRGLHRFYDPNNQREGQTGVENPRTGERRHDHS